MKIISIIIISMLLTINVSAQFGTAPDFITTDIIGTDFHLYQELDAGKPVILACMATWSATSFSVHNQYFLEELYQEYGPDGTNQIQVLFYEADANTTLQDLSGTTGNTVGDWMSNISYPIVNESIIQLPLEVFASQGIPAIKIIRPDDYEITNDVSCVESIDEIKEVLNNMITLYENTEQDFNFNFNASDVSCFGANDGEVYLDISGGFLPYQIQWFDGSSDTSRQNLLAGEYAVTVLDALENELLENILINEPPILQITNANILSETNNQQNGSISLLVEGGTSPYNFQWDIGDTNMDLEGIAGGEYSVTISDANSCEITETFFVDFETSLTDPLVLDLIVFPNPATSTINIKNLKEKGEVIYEITNDLGQNISNGTIKNNVISVENLPSGSYHILFRYNKKKIRTNFIKF